MSILANVKEFDEGANQIQAIFPQLVVQQIQNSLVARQILPIKWRVDGRRGDAASPECSDLKGRVS